VTIRASEIPFMRNGKVVTCDYVDDEGKVCGAQATRVSADSGRCDEHGFPKEQPEMD
jgi:hypothetical protein